MFSIIQILLRVTVPFDSTPHVFHAVYTWKQNATGVENNLQNKNYTKHILKTRRANCRCPIPISVTFSAKNLGPAKFNCPISCPAAKVPERQMKSRAVGEKLIRHWLETLNGIRVSRECLLRLHHFRSCRRVPLFWKGWFWGWRRLGGCLNCFFMSVGILVSRQICCSRKFFSGLNKVLLVKCWCWSSRARGVCHRHRWCWYCFSNVSSLLIFFHPYQHSALLAIFDRMRFLRVSCAIYSSSSYGDAGFLIVWNSWSCSRAWEWMFCDKNIHVGVVLPRGRRGMGPNFKFGFPGFIIVFDFLDFKHIGEMGYDWCGWSLSQRSVCDVQNRKARRKLFFRSSVKYCKLWLWDNLFQNHQENLEIQLN